MQNISFDAFEKSGLDLPKIDLSEKLSSFHDDFRSSVEPINGYFGCLATTVAADLPHWTQGVLDNIRSTAEAKIYKNIGLKGGELNGKEVLMRDIDPNLVDADGISNMQRMERGLSPVDASGEKIELHHVGQKADSPLAELTVKEHRDPPNNVVLHDKTKASEIDRPAFDKEREAHWKARAANLKEEMSFRGQMRAANDIGVKSGLTAAGLTLAISTVDNVRGVIAGEITPQKAFVNVAADTGTFGAIGYGVGFVSSAVAKTMANSSHTLIKSLGNAGVPAAVIAFGIDSYDSVIDYAQGEISGEELAIDLGESTTGVAGSIGGAALAGAAVGSVVPGAGTVVGFGAGLVGGMVGYAVATGAYATAIEVATGGIDVLADKAEAAADMAADAYSVVSAVVVDGIHVVGGAANDIASAVADKYTVVSAAVESAAVLKDKALEMGQSVIDSVASTVPDAVDDVKNAMNDFAASLGVLIHL
jgi:hypothetical protein